ncbi:MAG: helix-turn-helix transcriptional regulator [Lactobacillus sp.]|jgi:transcriptional regulator with XRE-family HTH domain|uniref:helix-turn-helix domain-containing protein n=1 Tax=Bombilactobacillus bombi TaxID=1303590 RepID=UPI0035E6C101|nr:helix-turn-helix transcriptional regulator [Lactobacillus sp.]
MFSERLKNERKLHHYTQEFVAQKIGVTRAAYSAYESGKRQPNFEILKCIAQILNISIDYLLENSNQKRYRNMVSTQKSDLGAMAEELLLEINKNQEMDFWGEPASKRQKAYLQAAIETALKLSKTNPK